MRANVKRVTRITMHHSTMRTKLRVQQKHCGCYGRTRVNVKVIHTLSARFSFNAVCKFFFHLDFVFNPEKFVFVFFKYQRDREANVSPTDLSASLNTCAKRKKTLDEIDNIQSRRLGMCKWLCSREKLSGWTTTSIFNKFNTNTPAKVKLLKLERAKSKLNKKEATTII